MLSPLAFNFFAYGASWLGHGSKAQDRGPWTGLFCNTCIVSGAAVN